MYRMDAWSQGHGAMWAPGTSGGAEVRTGPEVRDLKGSWGADEGDAEGASRLSGEGFDFDFEESDLDGVASY
ncbi:hypothetical protein [Corallococcus sicarius]|uniref:Uncharacterized protein n=1 Tax=Corallococcus sicarius TaxID=2316726 RepID=A0A3A8NT62_9BACT|nr:hypothetical protein [Corallococcus sicarius]RKH47223.1 hypothetical protein D7X12_03445 [Corallococcus sicarius]